MDTTTKIGKLASVIDPFQEAVAYETLLALEGSSERKLWNELLADSSALIKSRQALSDFLEVKRRNGPVDEIEALYPLVEKHLSQRVPFGVCTRDDFHYQDRFNDGQTPLSLFYYFGDINLLESPCVSIVGSRQATTDGLHCATEVARVLVGQGYTIVSGLAKGVDTAALEVAVSQPEGRAIGVIGTPLDQYYPKENQQLQDRIAANHLLISHVPFYRYEHEPFRDRRFYFPRRNVTMSAISQATVIIEASETSGTRSQAEAAIKQGRQLFIMESCFAGADWPAKFIGRGAVRTKDLDQLLSILEPNV